MNTLPSVRTPPHNKTMGIEIECSVPNDEAIGYGEYTGFFYAGSDISINSDWGRKGIEFVSQPLPVTWLNKEINKLYSKFNITSNYSCGIHIHVSRKWLSVKKARAIYAFLQTLSPQEQYDFFGRESNAYANTHHPWGADRRSVINNTNKHTIEFRMFSSGDREHALYCVACVEYLMQQAHHLNVDAFYAFVSAQGRSLSTINDETLRTEVREVMLNQAVRRIRRSI